MHTKEYRKKANIKTSLSLTAGFSNYSTVKLEINSKSWKKIQEKKILLVYSWNTEETKSVTKNDLKTMLMRILRTQSTRYGQGIVLNIFVFAVLNIFIT